MRKILIISHGRLSEGIMNTLELFIGESKDFAAISAYVDDIPVETKIVEYLSTIKDEDELIILSDLLGGSVNQKMIPYMSRAHTHLIAGFNLATLIQLSTFPVDRFLNTTDIEMLVEETKNSVVYVNDYFSKMNNNQDDE